MPVQEELERLDLLGAQFADLVPVSVLQELFQAVHVHLGIFGTDGPYAPLIDAVGVYRRPHHVQKEVPVRVLLVHLLEEPVERVLILPFPGDLQYHEKVPQVGPGELYWRGGHEDEALGLQLQRLHSLQQEVGFPPSACASRCTSVMGLVQEYEVVLHLSGLGQARLASNKLTGDQHDRFGAERVYDVRRFLGNRQIGVGLGPQHVIALKDPGGQVELTEHL